LLKLTLQIEDGPFAGRSLDLESGVLAIGRDAACGLRFESTEISRRHAMLTREPAGFVVADAGSTNGTLLNGERVVEASAVRDGDLIQLGPRGPRLRVSIRTASPAPPVDVTAVPTARVPALVAPVLYDPMRDKGRRYSPSTLVLIFGMLGLGAFLGLLVALLSFYELGFGASVVGVVVAFAPAPLYLAVWLWLDRNDPEPAWVLGACLVWGAGAATFVSGIVNVVFEAAAHALTKDPQLASFLSSSISAPVIEEATKGLCILLVFLFLRREFDGVIDGIVFAGVVALGFAAVENVLYYGRAMTKGGVGNLAVVFVLRGVLGPFGHAVYTSMTGIGLGIARRSHRLPVRIAAPILGYATAVLLHSLWNALAGVGGGVGFIVAYVFFWAPLFVAFFVAVAVMGVQESKVIRRMLELEVARGLITTDRVDIVASWTRRVRWLFGALGNGALLKARRDFLYAATRLALCYWHVSRAQEQGGVTMSFGEIARFQAALSRLRDRVCPPATGPATFRSRRYTSPESRAPHEALRRLRIQRP
jgi:RsiW-degrading membrane proteinase PrsW (M82 family)